MKKHLLALASVVLTFAAFSQTLPSRTNPSSDFRMNYENHTTQRAAGDSCGYMANAYLAIDKVQSFVWWNGPYYGASAGSASYAGAGQFFTCPQDMRISGFQIIYYFSPETTADSIPVIGTLYEANADSTPGAVIAFDTIWVHEQTPGTGVANYANFFFDNNPVMNTNFFLGTRLYTNDSIYYLSNDVGEMEDLSYYFYEDVDVPANTGWGNYLAFGALYDFDHLFFPLFKTEFSNDFTLVSDSICRGSDACMDVINTSAIINDSLWNRNAGNDTLFLAWDIGGSIEGSEMRSYCGTPTMAGDVNITMNDTIYFFNDATGKCPIAVSHMVHVVDSVNADFTFTNTGLQVDFTNTSTAADTYLWDFGDMNTNMDTNTTHTYGANGVYSVHLKAYNSCFEDSSIQSVDLSTVGLNEFSLEDVNLYPNPTTNTIYIQSDLFSGKMNLTIVNILGKVVLEKELKSNLEQIDLAPFGQGTYFFRLENNSKLITRKVVVQ